MAFPFIKIRISRCFTHQESPRILGGFQLTKIGAPKPTNQPTNRSLFGVAARLGTSPEPPSWPGDVDVEGLLGGSDFLPIYIL